MVVKEVAPTQSGEERVVLRVEAGALYLAVSRVAQAP